jgi:RNA polymerase sigma factor (sigma-70 family)
VHTDPRRSTVPIEPDRHEQIAALYKRHAERLRHAITAKTTALDAGLIDEACAFAWEKLLRRRDIDLERARVYCWLYRVALRQAWALGRQQHREASSGALSGADDEVPEPAAPEPAAPEPAAPEPDLVDVVADRVERATLHELMGELHWRERRELLLYAHGLSYEEISAVTRTTRTAVNRWLARGKKALRETHARASTTHTHPRAAG